LGLNRMLGCDITSRKWMRDHNVEEGTRLRYSWLAAMEMSGRRFRLSPPTRDHSLVSSVVHDIPAWLSIRKRWPLRASCLFWLPPPCRQVSK
jgi:hypothetical protein